MRENWKKLLKGDKNYRIEQSEVWTYQLFEEMTDEISFNDLDFKLQVSAIYANITFEPPQENFPEN